MVRGEDEVYEQIDKAGELINDEVSMYSGMSYEQGVRDALEWILGDIDDAPMDDE
jgi:hypothetical protein